MNQIQTAATWSFSEWTALILFVLFLLFASYQAVKSVHTFSWRLCALLLWAGFACVLIFNVVKSNTVEAYALQDKYWLLPVGYALIFAGVFVAVIRFILSGLQKLFRAGK